MFFSKPLNFALVYILSIANFTIILFPITFFVLPIFFIDKNSEMATNALSLVYFMAFVISILMLIYIFLDFLFGFSVHSIVRNCKNYQKSKTYEFLDPIFKEAKEKYNAPSVKLLIEESGQVNAFAVASLNSKYVVLTTGIISKFLSSAQNREEALNSMRGVIGHEMSHLINKDFLPGLLLKENERATIFLSRIVYFFFRIIIGIVSIIPLIGIPLHNLIVSIYNLTNNIILFFHKYIIKNIYMFTLKQISKNVEYRCDRDSAYAFGQIGIQTTLKFLGKSSYFTLFSTHPSTQSRIKRASYIKGRKNHIRVGVISALSNVFAILVVLYMSLFFGVNAHVPELYITYQNNINMIKYKIHDYKLDVMNLIEELRGKL